MGMRQLAQDLARFTRPYRVDGAPTILLSGRVKLVCAMDQPAESHLDYRIITRFKPRWSLPSRTIVAQPAYLPLPHGKAGLLVVDGVLGDLRDDRDRTIALRSWRLVLKPGGWLVVAEPQSSLRLSPRLGPEAWTGLLLNAGFADITQETLGRTLLTCGVAAAVAPAVLDAIWGA